MVNPRHCWLKKAVFGVGGMASATVGKDELTGGPQLQIHLTPAGSQRFAEITRQNINKRLAIIIDRGLYEAPVIRAEISIEFLPIEGSFTEREAEALARRINAAVKRHK